MDSYRKFYLTAAAMLLAFFPSIASAGMIWSDSFESGDFSKWSYVQATDTSQGGPGPKYNFVISVTLAKMKGPNGNYYAHFQRPGGLLNYPNAKVYKEWTTVGKLDQFGRTEDPIFNNGNVSATYSAWYYFPTTYVASTDWVNIFFFKEEGYDKNGAWMQNPSWWINVAPGDTWNLGSQPYLFANNNGNTYVNFQPRIVPLPMGKWFQITAKLYSGDRIEWYLNGKLFDTSYNSTYPVGRCYYNSTGWVFGVGHYLGAGAIYIDDVQVQTN